MKIIVCVKRVPFTQEEDLKIEATKTEVDREALAYVINEWDNYAIEEAVRLIEQGRERSRPSPSGRRRMRRFCGGAWPWGRIRPGASTPGSGPWTATERPGYWPG